jgi:hypothetical protein
MLLGVDLDDDLTCGVFVDVVLNEADVSVEGEAGFEGVVFDREVQTAAVDGAQEVGKEWFAGCVAEEGVECVVFSVEVGDEEGGGVNVDGVSEWRDL